MMIKIIPMTEEDKGIRECVHWRAFGRQLGEWTVQEARKHNIPLSKQIWFIREAGTEIRRMFQHQHNSDSMIMLSRRLLMAPANPDTLKIRGEQLESFLHLCEECCSKSDFPDIGAAKSVKVKLEFER